MKSILDTLNIDETFTKSRAEKKRTYNHIKNNIPLIEDYNYMADLLVLPHTKNKNCYLLVVVDIATDAFDIEPLKSKIPDEVVDAMKTMFKRKYIKIPYASIRTDNGNEFKGVFHKWLEDEKIFHKVNQPNRHSQMANVESLNKQLGRLFNGYMNHMEEKTGKVFKEWDVIVDVVRKELNKYRKKTLKPFNMSNNSSVFQSIRNPKYKTGQVVHYKLDWAENALGNKQPTPNFRMGDYRYSKVPKMIKQVLFMNDEPYFRYILEGMPNVSYSESQLIPSEEKETKYKVKAIIGKRIKNKQIEYLVWWDKYKKAESTYEPETQLRADGLGDMIDDYINKNDI